MEPADMGRFWRTAALGLGASITFGLPLVASAAPGWITHPQAVAMDAAKKPVSLQFRRELELSDPPRALVVDVSADNRFVLYVNGERAGAGPARGDLAHWRFETVDVARYLRPGRNVIAAQVWNDAENAPLAQISAGRTAFWLRARNPEVAALMDSGNAWNVRLDSSRTVSRGMAQIRQQVGQGFYAAGPPETFDGALLAADFAELQTHATGWQSADLVEGGAGALWTLTPDHLPQMTRRSVPSGRVVRVKGISAAGFPDRAITVPAHAEATLLVDAGRVLAAYPALTVSGGARGEVSLTYVEALYDPKAQATDSTSATTRVRLSDRAAVGDGLALGLTDVFKLDGAANQRFQPFWWRTWRFVEIRVKTDAQPLTLERLETFETGYPFEQRGRFVSSDPELNEVWRIGWMTALLDAHETYMDTAYWEQLQYIGDTRIQMLLSYDVAGDARLAIQALDAFDQSRAVEGLPQSSYPGVLKQVIPPFALLWIGALHDYWMHQPDTAVIVRTLPGTRAVLDEFTNHLEQAGLVGPMGGWPFVDWKPGLDGWAERGKGIRSCVISMQYVGALHQAADLERVFGEKSRADRYRSLADKTRDGVNAECWDESRGLYADTPTKQTFSQHATVLAVLHDIAPASRHRALIEKVLRRDGGIEPPAGMTGTSYYFAFYLAQALDHAGLTDRYLDLLKPWRQMLQRHFTTWPETPDPSRSDTHAWSSHPTSGLTTYVAGVRPDAPGFARVRIEPHLGSLETLDAAVAHPQGLIETKYTLREGKLNAVITLPAGVHGSFVWGGQTHEIRPGRNELANLTGAAT